MGIYDKIDGFVMERVNDAVRAYNWTTGRTRSDFSDDLATLGGIALATGSAYMGGPGYMVAPMFLLLTHRRHKENEKMERLEQQASMQGMKDPYVEEQKTAAKILGPAGVLSGASITTLPNADTSIYMVAGGLALHGASLYIMRSDYLPPKKNCISKLADKISEKIGEVRSNAHQPVLVTNRNYLENLVR